MNKTPNISTDNRGGSIAPENVPETNVGKINGRTPDEIKKGLEYCGNHSFCDEECAYYKVCCGSGCILSKHALAYIQQLESRLAQVELEKDAAVADLKLVRCCGTCVNNEGGCTTECYIVSGTLTGWKWRGICSESAKEE